jgi:hypothetical protein
MCTYPTDRADYTFLVRKIVLRAYGPRRQSFTDEWQVWAIVRPMAIGGNRRRKLTFIPIQSCASHAVRFDFVGGFESMVRAKKNEIIKSIT